MNGTTFWPLRLWPTRTRVLKDGGNLLRFRSLRRYPDHRRGGARHLPQGTALPVPLRRCGWRACALLLLSSTINEDQRDVRGRPDESRYGRRGRTQARPAGFGPHLPLQVSLERRTATKPLRITQLRHGTARYLSVDHQLRCRFRRYLRGARHAPPPARGDAPGEPHRERQPSCSPTMAWTGVSAAHACSFTPAPAEISPSHARFRIALEPNAETRVTLTVCCECDNSALVISTTKAPLPKSGNSWKPCAARIARSPPAMSSSISGSTAPSPTCTCF